VEAELCDEVVDMAAPEGVPADAGSSDAKEVVAPEDGRSLVLDVRGKEDPVNEGQRAMSTEGDGPQCAAVRRSRRLGQ
jgi:hypothetical protein